VQNTVKNESQNKDEICLRKRDSFDFQTNVQVSSSKIDKILPTYPESNAPLEDDGRIEQDCNNLS